MTVDKTSLEGGDVVTLADLRERVARIGRIEERLKALEVEIEEARVLVGIAYESNDEYELEWRASDLARLKREYEGCERRLEELRAC
jgi:hypothetical protein